MATFSTIFTQFFTLRASFTEDYISSQVGKVLIVTGVVVARSAFELSKIFYRAEGIVYCLSHYEGHELAVIEKIKSAVQTSSPGSLHSLSLNVTS